MNRLDLFIVVAILASCGHKITTEGIFFGTGNVTTQAEMGLSEWIEGDVTDITTMEG